MFYLFQVWFPLFHGVFSISEKKFHTKVSLNSSYNFHLNIKYQKIQKCAVKIRKEREKLDCAKSRWSTGVALGISGKMDVKQKKCSSFPFISILRVGTRNGGKFQFLRKRTSEMWSGSCVMADFHPWNWSFAHFFTLHSSSNLFFLFSLVISIPPSGRK